MRRYRSEDRYSSHRRRRRSGSRTREHSSSYRSRDRYSDSHSYSGNRKRARLDQEDQRHRTSLQKRDNSIRTKERTNPSEKARSGQVSKNKSNQPKFARKKSPFESAWHLLSLLSRDDSASQVLNELIQKNVASIPVCSEPYKPPPGHASQQSAPSNNPADKVVQNAEGVIFQGVSFMSVTEDDKRRLAQRQRQIDFGKNTLGYTNYLAKVPKHKRPSRNPKYPTTPDIHEKVSKRNFDGRVKAWRRALHDWDPTHKKSA